MAVTSGGRPLFIAPLVFAGAPIVNAIVSLLWHPPKEGSPDWKFYAGIVLAAVGAGMVLYSKGRPPKKDREKDGNTEYEEWIYGEPPHDVDFVRFVGDEVIRVETMKVDGEKVVRTEKEVNLEPQPTLADKQEQPQPRPANAPTLRRPGEEMPNASPQAPNPKVIAPPTPPVSPGPTPNSGPN